MKKAESADAIESGLAIQQRERETALRDVARLRKEAMAEIDRLLQFLDASDPYAVTELESDDDADLEDDGLAEPSLGSISAGENASQARWADGSSFDVEHEHDGAEPDEADYEASAGFDTGEPSLGWTVDGFVGTTMESDDEAELVGPGARPPQNRTELQGTIEVGTGSPFRKSVTGLTPDQRAKMRDRRRGHDSDGVIVR